MNKRLQNIIDNAIADFIGGCMLVIVITLISKMFNKFLFQILN